MRLSLILVGLLFVNSAVAEPKRLVCSYTDPKGLKSSNVLFPRQEDIFYAKQPIGGQIAYWENWCVRFGDEDYCIQAENTKAFAETGECQNLGYLSRYVFTIDTTDLNTTDESNGEFYSDNCGAIPGRLPTDFRPNTSDVSKVTMTSTPSVISFRGAHTREESMDLEFNIDRKTLKGGYVTDRSYQCKLEDVDTSDNLI